MEYVIIGMILFILATGTMWYRDAQVKNRLYEKLLKDFVAKLVACRVEVREGEFFLSHTPTNTPCTLRALPSSFSSFLSSDISATLVP